MTCREGCGEAAGGMCWWVGREEEEGGKAKEGGLRMEQPRPRLRAKLGFWQRRQAVGGSEGGGTRLMWNGERGNHAQHRGTSERDTWNFSAPVLRGSGEPEHERAPTHAGGKQEHLFLCEGKWHPPSH